VVVNKLQLILDNQNMLFGEFDIITLRNVFIGIESEAIVLNYYFGRTLRERGGKEIILRQWKRILKRKK